MNVPSQSSPVRRPFFYSKPFLLAFALVVVLLAAFTIYQFTRPMEPPSRWLSTRTVSNRTIVYYLDWTDDNGVLHGKFETALFAGGYLQVSSLPFTGTYDSQSGMLHMTFTKTSSAAMTLYAADAQISGDTLRITKTNNVAASRDAPTFHPASEEEYEQAKQQLKQGK